jgi:O-antigen ligase
MQLQLTHPTAPLGWLRLTVAALLATSVTFSVAAIGLFKLFAFLLAIAVVLWRPTKAVQTNASLNELVSPRVILLALLAFCLSLMWTSTDLAQALVALGKHGKLLAVPVLLLLIRTRAEARMALLGYVAMQVFVLVNSYIVASGFIPPYVPAVRAGMAASVFSSYLDESIMAAGFAAICWHLRDETGLRHGRWLACALAVLALIDVLYILPGRTGHLVAIAMVSMALIWSLPRRWRWATVAIPVLLLVVITASSSKFRDRVNMVVSESKAYSQQGNAETSSGLRLDYWNKSLRAMTESPVTGYGVGSWNTEYIRMSGGHVPHDQENLRNPHQEYLLWGVELGAPGLLLLLGVFGSLYLDATRLPRQTAQALKSIVVAGAVACLFNSALFDAVIGDYFCVLWGVLLAYGRTSPVPLAARPEPVPATVQSPVA